MTYILITLCFVLIALRAAGKYGSLKFINMTANKKSSVYMLENLKKFVNSNHTRNARIKYPQQWNTNPLVSSCLYVIGVYMCDPYLEIGNFQGF